MTTTEKPGCSCLLCDGDGPRGAFDERDRRIAADVREHGWHVMGVRPDAQGPGWAYSIGLWHTLRSPEVCVFGLPVDVCVRLVNVTADRVRAGAPLAQDQRRDDVLEGLPVVVRPVHPTWYPTFFGAGLDFQRQPPWPVAQVVWPDPAGRMPFEEGSAPECRAAQPPLWLPKDRVGGAWGAFDPLADWPFGPTLPYVTVLASPGVADGSVRPERVERDADGGWRFLAGADGGEPVPLPLGLVVHLHKDLADVAALEPGAHVDRTPEGTWPQP
jgi:hypothetical protein